MGQGCRDCALLIEQHHDISGSLVEALARQEDECPAQSSMQKLTADLLWSSCKQPCFMLLIIKLSPSLVQVLFYRKCREEALQKAFSQVWGVTGWRYDGLLCEADNTDCGAMWECPLLFELERRPNAAGPQAPAHLDEAQLGAQSSTAQLHVQSPEQPTDTPPDDMQVNL